MKSFFIALCILCAFPVNAETTVTIRNARILPTIWYSSLSAQPGETVRIYAGIQNDSGSAFSGTASFFVNGTVVGSTPFRSVSGSVERVGVDWTATQGNNAVRAVIIPQLDASQALVAVESDTVYYSVTKKLTLESVQDTVKEGVVKTATAAAEKLDLLADTLSSQLETIKATTPNQGKVLGASISVLSSTSPSLATYVDKAKVAGLSLLQFLLHHWRFTSAGLGILLLAFVFLKR